MATSGLTVALPALYSPLLAPVAGMYLYTFTVHALDLLITHQVRHLLNPSLYYTEDKKFNRYLELETWAEPNRPKINFKRAILETNNNRRARAELNRRYQFIINNYNPRDEVDKKDSIIHYIGARFADVSEHCTLGVKENIDSIKIGGDDNIKGASYSDIIIINQELNRQWYGLRFNVNQLRYHYYQCIKWLNKTELTNINLDNSNGYQSVCKWLENLDKNKQLLTNCKSYLGILGRVYHHKIGDERHLTTTRISLCSSAFLLFANCFFSFETSINFTSNDLLNNVASLLFLSVPIYSATKLAEMTYEQFGGDSDLTQDRTYACINKYAWILTLFFSTNSYCAMTAFQNTSLAKSLFNNSQGVVHLCAELIVVGKDAFRMIYNAIQNNNLEPQI